jgi:hypothetical protein
VKPTHRIARIIAALALTKGTWIPRDYGRDRRLAMAGETWLIQVGGMAVAVLRYHKTNDLAEVWEIRKLHASKMSELLISSHFVTNCYYVARCPPFLEATAGNSQSSSNDDNRRRTQGA